MSKIDTLCVHAGYTPGRGEPRQMPIVQSTTFKYETSDQMGRLFDLEDAGYFYTRLANPTCDMVAARINALEGGVGAILTSSGQAANLFACLNICKAGDHIVSLNNIYGGTFNLLGVSLKQMGIDVTFVDHKATDDEVNACFRPETKLLFGETLSNPGVEVLDIERFAKIAHAHGVPLVIDNTFATPVHCRPFEWGADIVTHSTTKYIDGHGVTVGGCLVDSGNFDWEAHADKFPGLTTPDASYHGLTYNAEPAERFLSESGPADAAPQDPPRVGKRTESGHFPEEPPGRRLGPLSGPAGRSRTWEAAQIPAGRLLRCHVHRPQRRPRLRQPLHGCPETHHHRDARGGLLFLHPAPGLAYAPATVGRAAPRRRH